MTLGISLGGWALVQLGYGTSFAALGIDQPAFNPLAWQLVFVIGMATTVLRPRLPSPNRWLTAACFGVVIFVACYVWIAPYVKAHGWYDPSRLGIENDESWYDSTRYHYVRLFYFIIAFYLLAQITPKPDSPMWQWPTIRAVRRVGVSPLACFGFGVVYTWADALLVGLRHNNWLAAGLTGIAGCVLTALLAEGLHRWKRSKAPAPRPG